VARQKLTDYERELASFFAELASIEDPGTFVATAKRMPPPPDLGGSAATNGVGGASPAGAEAGDGSDAGSNGQRSEKTLSERLAQLDQQLAAAAEFESPAATSATAKQEAAEAAEAAEEAKPDESVAEAKQEAAEAAEEAKPDESVAEAKQEAPDEAEEAKPDGTAAEAKQDAAEEAKPAAETPEAEKPEADKPETEAAAAVEPEAQKAETEKAEAEKPAAAAAEADALTPIVVKGLGSFGAITSFKQALERVDGVRGVTLSLGPTGEFVYRASHATEFDIVAAIRQIEGPSAGIEQAEGQVLVTVERQR
jgi:chemotaxis protein histidine kinase CheA